MNYTIDISKHAASLFIGQEPGEPEAEFLERAKLAEGQSFISLRVLDKRTNNKGKQFTMHSPYFETDNAEAQEAVITATFEAMGKAVLANEKIKLTEPPPKEESVLVLAARV